MKLKIPLANAVRTRDINVKALRKKLFVSVKGQPAIIDGELQGEVKNQDTTWQLDDEGRTLVINLEKSKSEDWWNRLMTTDPEVKLPRETEFNKMGYRTEQVKVPKH